MLFGDYFGSDRDRRDRREEMAEEFHGVLAMHAARPRRRCRSGWRSPGIATAWFLYIKRPDLPEKIAMALRPAVRDPRAQVRLRRALHDWFFAGGARALGTGLWKGGDQTLIDGLMVNGTARAGRLVRGRDRGCMQTGLIYHYAFTMIFGVLRRL